MSDSLSFDALGTQWMVTVDGGTINADLRQYIVDTVAQFERRFSRFIDTSEACAYRTATSGSHTVSAEMSALLAVAQELRSLTDGAYDPAIGGILEHLGYDAAYRFTQQQPATPSLTAAWTYENGTVTITRPLVFDFGGIGKGRCIDHVSALLTENGFPYHCVND